MYWKDCKILLHLIPPLLVWAEIDLRWIFHCTIRPRKSFSCSKASRYAVSRCPDFADIRFWIGSKNTWGTRILTKSLANTTRIFCGVSLFFAKYMQIFWVLRNQKLRNLRANLLQSRQQGLRAYCPDIYTLIVIDNFWHSTTHCLVQLFNYSRYRKCKGEKKIVKQ